MDTPQQRAPSVGSRNSQSTQSIPQPLVTSQLQPVGTAMNPIVPVIVEVMQLQQQQQMLSAGGLTPPVRSQSAMPQHANPHQAAQQPERSQSLGCSGTMPTQPVGTGTGPIAETFSSLAEGGEAVTQLLQEVLHEVRNIKFVDTKPKEGWSRAPSGERTRQDAGSAREHSRERSLEQLRLRCQELERSEHSLQEQVRELTDRRECLEAQVKEQERENAGAVKAASEQARRLEEDRRTLEDELGKAKVQLEKRISQYEEDAQERRQLVLRCEELQAKETALQEQVLTLTSSRGALECQAARREQDLEIRLGEASEARRCLADENRALRADLDRLSEQLGQTRDVERETLELQRRCQEHERNELELRSQVRNLSSLKGSLSAQMDERERELSGRLSTALEQARCCEAEKRKAESEAEAAKTQIHGLMEETRDLRNRAAGLEEQLRRALEKQQVLSEEKHSVEQDMQWRWQKFQECQNENKLLAKTIQDHKKVVWELEMQMRQDRSVANCCTPGEFLRLVKAYEEQNTVIENGRLKKALLNVECDLEACQRNLSKQTEHIKELQRGVGHRAD